MDFLEKENKYVAYADMPGYNKEDININIDKGVMYIHALKKELPCEKDAYYFR